MSKIKCVVFDWGGVLIDNPIEEMAKECAEIIGVEVESLKSTYSKFSIQFGRGLIDESVLWEKIAEKLHIKMQLNNSLWYQCFKKVYSPRNNIFAVAKRLKQNGYIVALLSNTEVPAMNFFNEQNYDMFEYKVFSCEEGEVKPELEIYLRLLNKIDFPPEEVIFIDDKFENIEAARKLKMKAVQYSSEEDLVLNLQKHQIKI